MSVLKVNEMFETIQGEGFYTGLPAIFIRLQGCPVGCPWCDTKHTWTLDPAFQTDTQQVLAKTSDSEQYFSADEHKLLSLFEQQQYHARHVVITGGEPAMYDLIPLTSLLIDKGYCVQIETSGTFEIQAHPDTWVTLSPKVDMKGGYDVLDQPLKLANEIKHPVAMQKHIDELDTLLARPVTNPEAMVYLQPISQQRRATELAVNTCINRNWRLSLQTHKFIGID
ncbi:7-carboxy-7-deazaguanine synthase QueE [Lacimicrobium alkaliphilum]|uniref:7-carboxy-7-deazaguanine synthase n=1 Tax=Lacimicrobium alkaliphilum TaxID=1526571 RepID=A0ABQ1RRQ8_9ALTE|nr:7-carboxy-7-deazaguanine synthase QueE [Lacimicrobium alkaliphilum]GGD75901.1 7-carboxy-7-deazaguanine synthase [Lacimicrobium alkaliphilum]